MQEATAHSCATALISEWIQRFGLPQIIKSDNGNTFVAALWKELQQQLGIDTEYTPPYNASLLGAVERRHRDIKASLKAALVQMANTSADKWVDRLPWIMLFRRSMIQTDLQTSPAELTLGMTPRLPGDLLGEEWAPMTNDALKDILEGLRTKSVQPPKQMTAHGEKPVHMPDSALQAEYVFVMGGGNRAIWESNLMALSKRKNKLEARA